MLKWPQICRQERKGKRKKRELTFFWVSRSREIHASDTTDLQILCFILTEPEPKKQLEGRNFLLNTQ